MTRRIDSEVTAARLDELNGLMEALGYKARYRLAAKSGWVHELHPSGLYFALRTADLPARIARLKQESATRAIVERMRSESAK